MRRFGWLAALAALCACAASPERDAEADCQPRAVLSPAGDGLRASYALCTPVTAFAFEPYNTPQRAADWTSPPGWLFDGGTLRRADDGAFEDFELRLAPDSRFHDRHYVAVDRVGAGWALFVQPLRPAEGPFTVRFAGFARDDVVRAHGRTMRSVDAALQIEDDGATAVYVGPPENVIAGAVTVVAGAEVPAWLRDRLLADMRHTSERMTARMGRAPPSAPTAIVTYRAGRSFSSGGAMDDDIVVMTLPGWVLSENDARFAEGLRSLVTHETVHFWIGYIWASARNDEEPWLHEGAAEYLASRIWQDSASLRAEAQEHLIKCLLRPNAGPLDGSEGAIEGSASYDCGFTIMLAAEAASLRAGRGDIFDLWRAVGEAAGPDGFTPDGFLAEARTRGGHVFDDAASILLGRAGDPRTEALGQTLSALGLDIRRGDAGPAESHAINARALMPLLDQLCGGGHGLSMPVERDRLILDTGNGCGAALAGNPEVVSVNGVHLMRAPGAAYEAIRTACAQRGAVHFGTVDGRTLAPVACAADIPPLPPIYEIITLPALPAP